MDERFWKGGWSWVLECNGRVGWMMERWMQGRIGVKNKCWHNKNKQIKNLWIKKWKKNMI